MDKSELPILIIFIISNIQALLGDFETCFGSVVHRV